MIACEDGVVAVVEGCKALLGYDYPYIARQERLWPAQARRDKDYGYVAGWQIYRFPI